MIIKVKTQTETKQYNMHIAQLPPYNLLQVISRAQVYKMKTNNSVFLSN